LHLATASLVMLTLAPWAAQKQISIIEQCFLFKIKFITEGTKAIHTTIKPSLEIIYKSNQSTKQSRLGFE
jgi:hypothetical protein